MPGAAGNNREPCRSKQGMKTALIIFLVLLMGCSNRPTLEELEDQALVTGDWTAVEERERELRARAALTGEQEPCPENATRVCFEKGMDVDCTCMKGGVYSGAHDYEKSWR